MNSPADTQANTHSNPLARTNGVKISFGIIVLNGEPFVKYCLRSLYAFAHEIIIVEGATKNAKSVSTSEGRSADGTLESIAEFIRDEDPEKKIRLITRDGFWEEKDEMSKAYASAVTGNYLWQIDIDEFYLEEDMKKIIALLEKDPSVSGMSFKMKSFWGGIDYLEQGPILGADIRRIFKFGRGYTYVKHRPPTVFDADGNNLEDLNWLTGETMAAKYGVYMYHYGFIFPFQAKKKAGYYGKLTRASFDPWADNYLTLKNPFRINANFEYVSWLGRYSGTHPVQISKMIGDIRKKWVNVQIRETGDIEKLFSSPRYILFTALLRLYFKSVLLTRLYFKVRRHL